MEGISAVVGWGLHCELEIFIVIFCIRLTKKSCNHVLEIVLLLFLRIFFFSDLTFFVQACLQRFELAVL